MTVYFVSEVGKPGLVKIGHTERLEDRLREIGCAFEEGIEVLAVCEGGAEMERVYHAMFSAHWVEGEWYRRSPVMDSVISTFSGEVGIKRFWGRTKAASLVGETAVDEDRRLALTAMKRVLGYFGQTSLARAQELAFQELNGLNPLWTRRRVRGIWEGCPRRIDHYEIRDLNQVASNLEARR